MTRLSLGIVACAGAAWLWGCGGGGSPQTEGETHWLSVCLDDRDCDVGSCLCGLCTASCKGDNSCKTDVPSRCYDTSSVTLARMCEGTEVEAVCLAACDTKRPCGTGQSCVEGACVADATTKQPTTDGGIAGEPDGRVASDVDPDRTAQDADPVRVEQPDPFDPDRASEDPTDYVDIEVDLDFDRPRIRPPRFTAFEGDHPDLLGRWRERCDTAYLHDRRCATLTFSRAPDGNGLVGSLELDRDPLSELDPGIGSAPPPGPFPLPSDPALPYPDGIDLGSHSDWLQAFAPAAPYPLLDGSVRRERVSFWASPVDLWQPWCALQQSYRNPGLASAYSCVPETASEDTVDANVLALCTDSSGLLPVCICDAEGCSAASHITIYRYTMTLEGDGPAVVTLFQSRSSTPMQATFEREAP